MKLIAGLPENKGKVFDWVSLGVDSNLSRECFEILAGSEEALYRMLAASNPGIPLDLLRKLLKDPYSSVVKAALENPGSRGMRHMVVKRWDEVDRVALAQASNTSTKVLFRLLLEENPNIRVKLALNKYAHQTIFVELSKDPHVWEELAKNHSLNNPSIKTLLDEFEKKGLPGVPGQTGGLSFSKLYRMLSNLAYNPNAKGDVLRRIYSIGDRATKESVLKNGSCSEVLLREAFSSGRVSHQIEVINHPNTSKKMLLEFGKRTNLREEVKDSLKNAIRKKAGKGLEL